MASASFAKARVLLVEDEPAVRELLAEVLAAADLDVSEAENGEQAMMKLEQEDGIDLLLTDVHMPGRFDGVDVALWARVLRPDLPVVFATGRPDAVQPFGQLGLREALLAKPFGAPEAVSAVNRLLAQRAPH